MRLLSVAMVAGKFVVDKPVDSVLDATSKDRQMFAAVVPAPSMNKRPDRISYLAPVEGVKVNAAATLIVGVVPALFPTINLSSVLPAVVSVIRSLNPKSPLPPLFASMFTPTAVGNAVERITLVVVAPAAIVPVSAKDGAKHVAVPAANVPASAGDWIKFQPFVTMLNRLRIVLLTS
jgi:hypothetical protein